MLFLIKKREKQIFRSNKNTVQSMSHEKKKFFYLYINDLHNMQITTDKHNHQIP